MRPPPTGTLFDEVRLVPFTHALIDGLRGSRGSQSDIKLSLWKSVVDAFLIQFPPPTLSTTTQIAKPCIQTKITSSRVEL